MKKKILFGFSVLFLFLFISCKGFFSDKQAGIRVRLPGGTADRSPTTEADKTVYYFKIQCENVEDNSVLVEYGKTGDVIIFNDIFPGNYIISGEAFADEDRSILLYQGSSEAEVTSKEITEVALVLKYVGSHGGSENQDENGEPEGSEEFIITITAANKQTSFLKNYFKELTVNYTDVDGTTVVKTLTDLLNEDYEIDIGDSHVTKETTAAEQFMIYTGIANLVPVKISKDGDIYTEYSAEIIFDGLKIGYIHDECEISVMNDDDSSRIALLKPSMKLIPLLSVNSEFDGENMDFKFDFSDPDRNIKLFKADGTYTTVTGSDIISANWTILFNNVQVGSGNDIAFNFSTIDTALQFPIKIKLQAGGEYLSTSDEFILEATGDPVDYTGVTNFTCTPPDTISFASNYLNSIRPEVTYRDGRSGETSLFELINDGFEVVVGDTSITASNYDEVFEDLIISYAGFVPFEVKKNGYAVGNFTGSIVFSRLALSASFEDSRHDYVPDILSVEYEFSNDDFATLKLRPMCKANFGEPGRTYNYFDFAQNDITYYEYDGTQQILSMSGSGNIVANWTVTFNASNTTKRTSSDPELLFSSFDSLIAILRYPVKITCELQSSYIPSGFSCVIVIDEDGYVDYE